MPASNKTPAGRTLSEVIRMDDGHFVKKKNLRRKTYELVSVLYEEIRMKLLYNSICIYQCFNEICNYN